MKGKKKSPAFPSASNDHLVIAKSYCDRYDESFYDKSLYDEGLYSGESFSGTGIS